LRFIREDISNLLFANPHSQCLIVDIEHTYFKRKQEFPLLVIDRKILPKRFVGFDIRQDMFCRQVIGKRAGRRVIPIVIDRIVYVSHLIGSMDESWCQRHIFCHIDTFNRLNAMFRIHRFPN
jgi:hypothetical protein